ncbi:Cytoskeleton-associated protein 4 [Varanus komodoensis]|uniref:Cytoskeleton associated protein 4 n=1 Tax=Varanus komodoensis TaxID=61221 RepID=A0A8D2KXL3_VARKO|nr:cytoskeleton-associated protein 4 [Varanus komodoensis]KAF7240632.1 Cytoskeleton-associated protein 4 [Varanus komodoensis]
MSSSVKQRSNKGGGGAPSEKGAHSSHPDDVAKKQQQQQQQNPAHPKGSKGGSPFSGGGGRSASFCSLGKLLNFFFVLVLLASAAFVGYYVHHLLEEVNRLGVRQEGLARQREELARTVEGTVQKVQSLQSAFGGFELTLKNTQEKQEVTNKAVRQGETEISRIGEVLQKLQNEILKDLSDGIHVVKDARERDFTSLENTVEERLTELTKSINDNIAEFTHVQKQSQDEINEVKTKVALLGETEIYKDELQVLKGIVDEMQASMRAKEKTIESLQSTIDSMESDVLSEVKELINLKQEHERFKEAADTEHLSLQALEEKVLKAEESVAHLPDEFKRLKEELELIRSSGSVQEGNALSNDMIENLQKNNEEFQSRLESIERNLQTLVSPSTQHTEEIESSLSLYESKLATLEENLGSLRGTLESDVRSVTDSVRGLSEAQLLIYNDVDELRKSVTDLPNNAEALGNIQKQVRALLDQERPPTDIGQSKDNLEELSSMKDTINELQSSFGQVESDLKMLRAAVDSLVDYSVKIESNENDVHSVKSSLDDIRNDLDRLFVKVENIHERV